MFTTVEKAWSLFRIPEIKSMCAFITDNMLLVIGCEGTYYVAVYDPENKSDCIKKEEISLNINPYSS